MNLKSYFHVIHSENDTNEYLTLFAKCIEFDEHIKKTTVTAKLMIQL